MKTRTFCILILGTILSPLSLTYGQNCPQFDRMIEDSRKLLGNEKYVEAINKLSAAREYCPEKSKRVDEEIQYAVKAIEARKKQSDQDRIKAESAQSQAEAAKKQADQLRAQQAALYEEAKKQTQLAENEKLKADSLVIKGLRLAETLSDDPSLNIAEYLSKQGEYYFQTDPVSQQRDYRQAHVYFALARFMSPGADPVLETLVDCAKVGKHADQLYLEGAVDSGILLYTYIANSLDQIRYDNSYEARQLQRLREVRSKWDALMDSSQVERTHKLVLSQTWWTIPDDILRIRGLQTLRLENIREMEGDLPDILTKIDSLSSLTIQNCNNISSLTNWGNLHTLKELRLSNNTGLEVVQFPETFIRLAELKILGSQNLDEITGLENLTGLQTLSLISNSRISELKGGKSYPDLQHLSLLNNTNLKSITGFEQLPRLISMQVIDNKLVSDLTNFANLPDLSDLSIQGNSVLKKLPDWKNAPGLQNLSILNNRKLRTLGNLKALRKIPKVQISRNHLRRFYVGSTTDGMLYTDTYYFPFYKTNPGYSGNLFAESDFDRSVINFRLNAGYFPIHSESGTSEDRFWTGRYYTVFGGNINYEDSYYLDGTQDFNLQCLKVALGAVFKLRTRKLDLYLIGSPVYIQMFKGHADLNVNINGDYNADYTLNLKRQHALFGEARLGVARRFRNFKVMAEFSTMFSATYDSDIYKFYYIYNENRISESPSKTGYELSTYRDLDDGLVFSVSLGVAVPLKFY